MEDALLCKEDVIRINHNTIVVKEKKDVVSIIQLEDTVPPLILLPLIVLSILDTVIPNVKLVILWFLFLILLEVL